MSTAHIFYVPVLVLIGVFAGYFVGRQAAENEQKERVLRRKRRAAIQERNSAPSKTSES